jgi:uncharacterized protein YcbK (DUF882 family)
VEKTKHTDNAVWNDPLSENWAWPNFLPEEFACHHCGQNYHWPAFMDKLQTARGVVGRSFVILSGHRCSLHNARVGGAPLSQHLKLAVDISTYGHERATLFQACDKAGFTGFGFYQTFLHIDLGRPRRWWSGEKARRLWRI